MEKQFEPCSKELILCAAVALDNSNLRKIDTCRYTMPRAKISASSATNDSFLSLSLDEAEGIKKSSTDIL